MQIVRQYSFVEIDNDFFFYGHSLPSADLRRAVVSFWWNHVHKYLLTAQRTKPVQEKCGKLTATTLS